MMKILESKAVRVIEDPKSEPKIDDKLETGPEVVAELVSSQERFSFGPQKLKSSLLRPL